MSDLSRRPSEAAYAELVAAVLALRADPASERFDALLAELTAAGLLDPATARELRWWQRESVRAVGDHLVETVPASLVALDQARGAALDATAMAEQAWHQAAPPRPHAPSPDDGAPLVDLRGGEDELGDQDPAQRADASEGREGQTGTTPLASTRGRLLVAGLSVLPDRPSR